jgi:hypothetical protein
MSSRFFLATSVALIVSGSAFAGTEPGHFRGALVSGEAPQLRRVSLEDNQMPVEQMSHRQLQLEYQRLDNERPSLGGAIAMTAVGGGLLLFGGAFLLDALGTFLYFGGSTVIYAAAAYILLVFGAALAITGVILLPIGLVKLFGRVAERRVYSQRMDDISARMETLDRSGGPDMPPPPPTDLPPAPPPPPGAWQFGASPTQVVATF